MCSMIVNEHCIEVSRFFYLFVGIIVGNFGFLFIYTVENFLLWNCVM